MEIIERELYTILKYTREDSDFPAEIEAKLKQLENKNIIIDLLEKDNLKNEELLKILLFSKEHKSRMKSFVLVNNSVTIEEVPAELLIAPTIQEAEDLVQMEEIERELGF